MAGELARFHVVIQGPRVAGAQHTGGLDGLSRPGPRSAPGAPVEQSATDGTPTEPQGSHTVVLP